MVIWFFKGPYYNNLITSQHHHLQIPSLGIRFHHINFVGIQTFSYLFITAKIWKQPKCPLPGEQINCGIYPDDGILSNAKKKWAIKSWKDMKLSYVHIPKWKKSIWKDYILYGSRTIWCSRKGKIMEILKGWMVASGEREMNRWNTEDFRAAKLFFLIT